MFSHSIRTFPEKGVGEADALGRASQPRSLGRASGQAHRGIHFPSQRHNRAGLQQSMGRTRRLGRVRDICGTCARDAQELVVEETLLKVDWLEKILDKKVEKVERLKKVERLERLKG